VVTSEELLVVSVRDAGTVPKCTTESAGSFVVHVMFALDVPTTEVASAEIVGGVVSGP
jgi:hypothetical protein